MKDFFIFLPLTIVYLVVKSTLFPAVPLPDIPLITVFYMGCRNPTVEGAVMGFALGYLEDSFNAGIIGSTSFALVMVFLAVHLLSKKVHFITPFVKASTAFALTLFKGLLVFTLLWLMGFNASFGLLRLLEAIVTGALAPAALTLLSGLSGFFNRSGFERNSE